MSLYCWEKVSCRAQFPLHRICSNHLLNEGKWGKAKLLGSFLRYRVGMQRIMWSSESHHPGTVRPMGWRSGESVQPTGVQPFL